MNSSVADSTGPHPDLVAEMPHEVRTDHPAIPSHAIVVGLDHSPQSTVALEWAAAEAICRGLPLHLIHAVQPHLWPDSSGADDCDHHPAGCVADALQALADSNAGVPITWSQPYGSALPALTWASRFATMIVVGTHGRGALLQIMTSSTAVELIAYAHCPVVVLRTPLHRADAEFGRVVVGLEGRPSDGDALQAAFREAETHQRALVVVHATDYGFLERARIEHLVVNEHRKHSTVRAKIIVKQGDPAELLVAHSAQASLVVLGSHGRHEAAGLILGSVSQAVLRDAACPVMVAGARTLRPDYVEPGVKQTKDETHGN